MKHFVRIISERQDNFKLDESVFPQQHLFETDEDVSIIEIPLPRNLSSKESDEYAHKLANFMFESGYNDFDIEISNDEIANATEITYESIEEFHQDYGILGYVDNDYLWEAEYQGRKVTLNKPTKGDVKKFKVYVKNSKGNVVKVNFGDPNMRIKKSNPARRRSFRARHNCKNPGPKTKARYWSCRAW